MDEPPNDPPSLPSPPPLPGGFRAKEVTAEELREMRDSWLGGPRDGIERNGIKSEWDETRRAFGDFIREGREQRGLFRDEAANDRRAVFEISRNQIEASKRSIDTLVTSIGALGGAIDRMTAGNAQLHDDFGAVQTSVGEMRASVTSLETSVGKLQTSVDRSEASSNRTRHFVYIAGAAAMAVSLIALGFAAASWTKADRVERQIESSEVFHGPRAAAIAP